MNKSEEVVKEIIGRDIDWYDPGKLDKGRQAEYYGDAKHIVESDVFNNEMKHYIADMMKFITYESKNHDQTLHARSLIVGLETFKMRLKTIEQPVVKKEIDDEEKYAGI